MVHLDPPSILIILGLAFCCQLLHKVCYFVQGKRLMEAKDTYEVMGYDSLCADEAAYRRLPQ